jgi:predicted HTH transcriptional regulator
MGKALSCNPPVQIEIYTENTSSNPFFRVEIPSGHQKPYCTNSGTYKIREDARNHPLHPEQLHSMFLDREGEEFRDRFSQAAGDLEGKMAHTLDIVGDLESIISSKN